MRNVKGAEALGLKTFGRFYLSMVPITPWEWDLARKAVYKSLEPPVFSESLPNSSFGHSDIHTIKENFWDYLIEGSFQHLHILSNSVFPSTLNCTTWWDSFEGNWRVQQYSETTRCDNTKDKNSERKSFKDSVPPETGSLPFHIGHMGD